MCDNKDEDDDAHDIKVAISRLNDKKIPLKEVLELLRKEGEK